MSSIGVSMIVRVARAVTSRQGRLVLLSPRPNVADVLARTQIDQLIPVFGDLAAARTAVLDPSNHGAGGGNMEPVKTHTLEPDASRAETTSVSSRTFPADRTAPRAAAAWLRSLPTGLSPTRLADAELCLDELVTNVVRYAWTEPATSAPLAHRQRRPQPVRARDHRRGRRPPLRPHRRHPPADCPDPRRRASRRARIASRSLDRATAELRAAGWGEPGHPGVSDRGDRPVLNRSRRHTTAPQFAVRAARGRR